MYWLVWSQFSCSPVAFLRLRTKARLKSLSSMFVLSSCPASCRSVESYIPLSNVAGVKSPDLSAQTRHITLPPVCLHRARIITVSKERDATAVVSGWFIALVDGYLLWLEHKGCKIKRSCEWFPLFPPNWLVAFFILWSVVTARWLLCFFKEEYVCMNRCIGVRLGDCLVICIYLFILFYW